MPRWSPRSTSSRRAIGLQRTNGTLGGLVKTTIYLPEGLDLRLEARASSSGTSKAELELPVFDSGLRRSVSQLDQDLIDHVGVRAARR